jgi:hypothetical protein
MKYYRLDNILKHGALYNIIFGERSNGKTYAVQEYALKKYLEDGSQLAVLRRWRDDFVGKRGQMMFSALVENGVVDKLTNGEWTDIYYHASRWYLCRYEGDKRITSEEVFAFGFSITAQEHDKSTSYPKIRTVLFDEFITRTVYAQDEFILFQNVLSTIIRQRTDVTIFMLGNTVNKFCPYFNEMGLKHISKMQAGDIDVYNYGESNLKVAVEYTKSNKKGKPSDVYFAFDNPKLKMITGGEWELDIYPHCPEKIRPCDVVFKFFIDFDGNLLQGNVISSELGNYLYIHRKTTPLKDCDTDLIFSLEISPRPNVRKNIMKPPDNIGKKIAMFFVMQKVFYSTNDVGEIVRNYLQNAK